MIKKILAILILPIFIFGCSEKVKKIQKDRFLFGTYIGITVYSDNENEARTAIDKAFDEIERIDKKYNSKVEESLISRLNTGELKEIELDDEGIYLFTKLKEAYEISNKKYDITIGPLLEVWDFGEEVRKNLPTQEEINNALSKVGFDNVILEGNKLYFGKKGMEIDTGSFLKGYAIEKAKEKLKEQGIKSAFITSISSIETIGTKPEEKPWKIGIENPENPEDILEIIELDNQGMGVSGDYQTYVEIDGKKYHHILDKTTGYPMEDKKMVVVISDDAFYSDMYSTAFFLMNPNDIISFADKNRLKVLIVDKDMNVIKNKTFHEVEVIE